MRILIINSILYTPSNGQIPPVKSIKHTMIYTMCRGFKELGHDVTLCAAAEYAPVEPESYDFEIRYFPSSLKKILPPSVLPFSPAMGRFIRSEGRNFDLIISSEVFSFPSLFCSLFVPDRTVVWHELALHQKKFHHIPSKLWYNIVAPLFMRRPLVVARSNDARDFISKYLSNISDRVVEHGTDPSKFVPRRDKENAFIVIARLVPYKNVDRIIRIFAKFSQTPLGEGYKLRIFGRGPLEDDLKQLACDLNVEDSVVFHGFTTDKEELGRYMAAGAATLFASDSDNNLVSVPESIMCGTPILGNRAFAQASTIEAHSLGVIKDGWDVDEMHEIVANNKVYVDNCMDYAHRLTHTYCADSLIQAMRASCK